MTMEAVHMENMIPSLMPESELVSMVDGAPPAHVTDPTPPDDLDQEAMEAMFKAKKKKKPKHNSEEQLAKIKLEDPLQEGECNETYDEMLDRIYRLMGHTKTAASESFHLRLKRPRVERIGSKRTGWANFSKTAETLNRTAEHMASFVEAEFGTEVSQSASGVLVIKGRFGSEHIESLLRKYVEQYVTCRTCIGMDTTLFRDPQTRLIFLRCNVCQSTSSVGAIQKGFKATTKADRKNERAKV